MKILQRHQPGLLWFCQSLFLLRVFGQIEALLVDPAWLPPFASWYSGWVPYSILLPLQIGLLMLMSVVSYDHTRKSGYWYVERYTTRKTLVVLSAIYFLAMLLRYLVQMVLYPETQWFGGTIPIVFHWVLATYLWLTAQTNTQPAIDADTAPAAGARH